MKNLETLIKELCPEGVEFVKLGDVCDIYTGEQLNKSNLSASGTYPCINGGINPSGYTEQYNEKSNTITISQGGASAGYVNWIQTDFWAGAHCYIVKPLYMSLLNRYLYHFLKNYEPMLMGAKVGAGIPGLNRKEVKKIEIPLPPIEVQTEIVRILDKFTALEAELEAELNCRKRQYEYYRDKLLAFENVGGAKCRVEENE